MDRGYFLTGFGIASVSAFIVAVIIVGRVDAWRLLRPTNEDPRSRVYRLASVVVLLWVTTALLTQIVSATATAATQALVFSGDLFESGSRIRWLSLSSGVSVGVQLGFALGLIGFVLRAAMEIRWIGSEDDDPELDPEDADWSRPPTD